MKKVNVIMTEGQLKTLTMLLNAHYEKQTALTQMFMEIKPSTYQDMAEFNELKGVSYELSRDCLEILCALGAAK